MNYITQFDIAAICILLIMFTLYFLRKNYPTLTNKIYVAICGTALASSVFDLIGAYTVIYKGSVSPAMNYTINILYLLAYNATCILFYIYVLTITKPNRIRMIDRLYYIIISALDFILIVSTPWTKMIFYFDDNLNYQHGPIFLFLYISSSFLLIQILIQTAYHRKKLNSYQVIAIVFFTVATVGAVLFQMIYPHILVGNFAIALFTIVVHVSLQNPEYYIEKNSLCYNTNAFQESLERAFYRNTPFTLVTFSLNGIQYINQVLGMQRGNELITGVIGELHKLFGQRNVYRLTGNRFAIWLHDASEEEHTITLLREHFSSPVNIQQIDVLLVPQICVVHHPDFAESPADITNAIDFSFRDLMRRQDHCVIVASADSLIAKQREAHILHILRRAIKKEEFNVYYQPIYDTESKSFKSAEALIRLYDDKLGFISPDEFIPMAEQNGMIIEIGEIVFRHVCRFLQQNDLEGLGVEYIEVNLSTVQCVQDNLTHQLMGIMEEYNIKPGRINFEITETAGSQNADILLHNMNQLIESGSSFSMDDYGTGFSTANYLINLPMHIVKIDKSILWSAMKDDEALIVLEHTVSMLKALNKQIVVEGVETEKMAEILISMGCDYLQGYLYSKPVPSDQYLDFLRENLIA